MLHAFRKRKNETDLLLFLFCELILFLILIKRCRYGYANIDEMFYLTVPYRLCMGDSLFVSEWNLSQLSGVLLYLPVKVFLAVNGGTEYMTLAFRYIYVCAQLVSALIIFICLRKYSRTGAFVSALVFMIYAPFGIPALSYNSMGIIFLELALVFFISDKSGAVKLLSGICFSAAVLCCPYLALLLLLLIPAFIPQAKCAGWFHSELGGSHSTVLFLGGIVISALAFLCFLFSRAGLHDILRAIPFILNDPEHTGSVSDKLIGYFPALIQYGRLIPVYIAYLILLIAGLLSKGRHSGLIIALAVTVGIIHEGMYAVYDRYINFFIFPVNIVALICYTAAGTDRLRTLFRCLWIPGMLYTLCIHLASNQMFYAISSASVAALPASIIIIIESVKETASDKLWRRRSLTCLTALMLALQFSCVAFTRWNNIFWDRTIDFQTEYIEDGPEKGLLVSSKFYDKYYSEMMAFNEIADYDRVLLLMKNTWGYLYGGKHSIAGYSAWLSGVSDNSIDRLCSYYDSGFGALPDVIVSTNDYADHLRLLAEKYDYSLLSETPEGYLIATK